MAGLSVPLQDAAMIDLDVSALVSSRICHDLISPIGAISNGVELLSDASATPSQELGLIGESVNSATLRLRFFRLAFGATPDQARVPTHELVQAVGALTNERTKIDLRVSGDDISRIAAKVMLLALLCQERALPLGGQTAAELSDQTVRVTTSTDRVRDIGPLWNLVDNPDPTFEVAPAEVQFLVLGQILQQRGAKLSRDRSDAGLSIAIEGIGA